MNKLSETLGYFTLIYMFNLMDEKVISRLTELVESMKKELESIGIKLIDWRIERESLVFLLNFFGALDKKKTVEKLIDEGLKSYLSDLINYRKIVSQESKRFIFQPLDISRRKLEISIFRKYLSFLHYLSKFESIKEEFPVELKNNNDIAWCMTYRKNIIKNHMHKITGLINKWREKFLELNEHEFSLLYLIFAWNDSVNKEVIIEACSFMLNLDPNLVNKYLDKMLQKGMLITDEDKFLISEETRDFLNDFMQTIMKIEISGIRSISIRRASAFIREAETAQPRYIVHRNGNLSIFSLNKLVESLIFAGIDSNVANKAVHAVTEYIGQRNIIPESELISLVKIVLNVLDPTGESGLKYDFFVNTRDKIIIKYKDLTLPFSYDSFQFIIKEKLLSRSQIKIAQSLLNMIVAHVLKMIRSFFALAFKDITRKEPIIITEKNLDTVIDETIRLIAPMYERIIKGELNEFIIDATERSISFFEKVLANEKHHKIELLLNDFLNGAKYLICADY